MKHTVKHMKAWSKLETNRNNKYVYDRKTKRVQFCHPLLFYIIKLNDSGRDVETWLKELPDDGTEIENIGRYSKNDIIYYYQKYLLLKENGHFTTFSQGEKLAGGISPETVKHNLANATQVTFEVTDRCNLDCRYCGYGEFYSDYDKRENKDLDFQSARNLLDYLMELWNSPMNRSHDRNVYISFYGGEPLMNFSFIEETVRYIENHDFHHNRFTFSMTTNALLLEKYMDFLVKHDFSILISLDGNEENTAYRKLKNGKPSYNTILENVMALKNKYPEYFRTRVNFNAVLHNKNSVADIYHYFKEQFDKTPMIGELNTSGIKESQKKEFLETYANINQSLYQSEDYSRIEKDMFLRLPGAQQVMEFLHFNNDCCFHDYNRLIYSNDPLKRTPTGTCSPFSKKIFVTVNGKILPCERIGQQYGLGTITPEGVHLDFEKIAETYNSYFDKMRKLCNVCNNAVACKQCIFNLDTLMDKKPACNGFMTEDDYSQYLSSIIGYVEKKPEVYSDILKGVIIE